MEVHREDLEEEATHATDEARMVLPGVQAIMGFQLIAVFNQRFESLSFNEQLLHLAAFFLVTLSMGLIMAPAAYHRQVERGRVTRRFVDLASALLSLALIPLMVGVAFDSYILTRLVIGVPGQAVMWQWPYSRFFAGCGLACLMSTVRDRTRGEGNGQT